MLSEWHVLLYLALHLHEDLQLHITAKRIRKKTSLIFMKVALLLLSALHISCTRSAQLCSNDNHMSLEYPHPTLSLSHSSKKDPWTKWSCFPHFHIDLLAQTLNNITVWADEIKFYIHEVTWNQRQTYTIWKFFFFRWLAAMQFQCEYIIGKTIMS